MNIDELKRLHEAATPGDWAIDGDDIWHFGEDYHSKVDPHLYTGISCNKQLRDSKQLKANATLTCYLRNHTPAIIALAERVRVLEEALATSRVIAQEAFDAWDGDRDMRVGKLLKALAGCNPGYRADIDAITNALNGGTE